MACEHQPDQEGRAGDWVELLGSGGQVIRRGLIVELLGGPGREHFQVRWDEDHESMVFPRPGVRVVVGHRA